MIDFRIRPLKNVDSTLKGEDEGMASILRELSKVLKETTAQLS